MFFCYTCVTHAHLTSPALRQGWKANTLQQVGVHYACMVDTHHTLGLHVGEHRDAVACDERVWAGGGLRRGRGCTGALRGRDIAAWGRGSHNKITFHQFAFALPHCSALPLPLHHWPTLLCAGGSALPLSILPMWTVPCPPHPVPQAHSFTCKLGHSKACPLLLGHPVVSHVGCMNMSSPTHSGSPSP